MPFMKGPAPIRRTLKYLEAGKLILKDQIKVLAFHYNFFRNAEGHEGVKEFVFWYVPQIQYKNPNVQICTLRHLTPSPFIRCFYESGHEMLIDCENKNRLEILEHLIKVVGKTEEVLKREAVFQEKKGNPANFGVGCQKHCICEIPGQIPCPGVVPLPNCMRAKYIYAKD